MEKIKTRGVVDSVDVLIDWLIKKNLKLPFW